MASGGVGADVAAAAEQTPTTPVLGGVRGWFGGLPPPSGGAAPALPDAGDAPLWALRAAQGGVEAGGSLGAPPALDSEGEDATRLLEGGFGEDWMAEALA